MNWIVSFLSNRKKRAIVSGFFTTFVSGGVPQGTILGLVLFSIMENDITPVYPECNLPVKYADDLPLSVPVTADQDHSSTEVDRIENWAVENRIWNKTSKRPGNKSRFSFWVFTSQFVCKLRHRSLPRINNWLYRSVKQADSRMGQIIFLAQSDCKTDSAFKMGPLSFWTHNRFFMSQSGLEETRQAYAQLLFLLKSTMINIKKAIHLLVSRKDYKQFIVIWKETFSDK